MLARRLVFTSIFLSSCIQAPQDRRLPEEVLTRRLPNATKVQNTIAPDSFVGLVREAKSAFTLYLAERGDRGEPRSPADDDISAGAQSFLATDDLQLTTALQGEPLEAATEGIITANLADQVQEVGLILSVTGGVAVVVLATAAWKAGRHADQIALPYIRHHLRDYQTALRNQGVFERLERDVLKGHTTFPDPAVVNNERYWAFIKAYGVKPGQKLEAFGQASREKVTKTKYSIWQLDEAVLTQKEFMLEGKYVPASAIGGDPARAAKYQDFVVKYDIRAGETPLEAKERLWQVHAKRAQSAENWAKTAKFGWVATLLSAGLIGAGMATSEVGERMEALNLASAGKPTPLQKLMASLDAIEARVWALRAGQ